jgi:hypothetical protein
MLKSIPKSNITRRKFQVYKRWNTSQSEYPAQFVSGSNPLYRSVKSKYYSNLDGNVINLFGPTRNPAELQKERRIGDYIYVIDIDRNKLGEQIKRKSLKLITHEEDSLIDDGFGRIINEIPTYRFTALDLEEGILTIEQNDGLYEIDVQSINLETRQAILLFDGDVDTYYLISIDFELGIIKFEAELDFDTLKLDVITFGNVFYSDGIIVFNSGSGNTLETYELEYRSTQTIYETEVLVSVRAGEFNYSQNPSAVEVKVSGSYYFETTPITNVSPAKTVRIKEISDIKQRQFYSGSINPSKVGTWNDYFNSSSVDPTGSYLAPFITTIALYDDDGDMVAIAKLPQPIKNLPDYDLNFLIRFDT